MTTTTLPADGLEPKTKLQQVATGEVMNIWNQLEPHLPDEYEIVTVLYGDVYICEWDDDGRWQIEARYDAAYGHDGCEVADEIDGAVREASRVNLDLGSRGRFIAWVNEDE